MALRNVIKIGDPILNKISRPVKIFDERLSTLIDDMFETLSEANGVGLAAVQVGILKRIVVIHCEDTRIELVNPVIIKEEGEQRRQEGCLSLPGKWGTTIRPAKVQVKAQDRTGKWHIYTGTDLMAQALCHEIDHLDGILFTSHVIKDESKSKG